MRLILIQIPTKAVLPLWVQGIKKAVAKQAYSRYNDRTLSSPQVESYKARNGFLMTLNLYMIISWYGEGCFRIQNGETSVLTDPIDSSSGLSAPRGKYNMLLKTLTPWPFPFGQEGEEKDGATVWGAGEYDIAGIAVRGFALPHESSDKFFKTAYLLTWDDITIGILGHISEELPPAILENFEEIDVLIGPAGGAPFLDQEKMARVIKQITPKIFIPSFYKVSGLKRKTDDAKGLVERVQSGPTDPQEKFVFKKKDLDEIKKTQVVCLKI